MTGLEHHAEGSTDQIEVINYYGMVSGIGYQMHALMKFNPQYNYVYTVTIFILSCTYCIIVYW